MWRWCSEQASWMRASSVRWRPDLSTGQCCNTCLTKEFFKDNDITLLNHFVCPNYLNLIENVWGWKGSLQKQTSVGFVKPCSSHGWRFNLMATLVSSMPKQTSAVINKNGGATHYWVLFFVFLGYGLLISWWLACLILNAVFNKLLTVFFLSCSCFLFLHSEALLTTWLWSTSTKCKNFAYFSQDIALCITNCQCCMSTNVKNLSINSNLFFQIECGYVCTGETALLNYLHIPLCSTC